MPRLTDTAELFPEKNDAHATHPVENGMLSPPSRPPVPTRNGPYFAKQNKDDAPLAVTKP